MDQELLIKRLLGLAEPELEGYEYQMAYEALRAGVRCDLGPQEEEMGFAMELADSFGIDFDYDDEGEKLPIIKGDAFQLYCLMKLLGYERRTPQCVSCGTRENLHRDTQGWRCNSPDCMVF